MEKSIELKTNEEAIALYGSLDENLRYAEKEYGVRISARNHRLKIIGNRDSIEKAYAFFVDRLKQVRGNRSPKQEAEATKSNANEEVSSKSKPSESKPKSSVTYFFRGKVITARSKNQEKYLESIRMNDVVFGIGPAGTGKTYLAMAAAVDHLKKKLVDRIILTRPAVEAGESLGFLPGDFAAKVNPYLRPLYDALHDMMDYDEVARCLERGVIEVAPIAYMRGRTLSSAFVVLDEAQNCTNAQMKMFLTRMGQHSKMVVTGDITQIDLPSGKKSGLVEVQNVLNKVAGIKFVYFEEEDVVRHPLVQRMIHAYDKHERKIIRKNSS